jgi:hypothetical protein
MANQLHDILVKPNQTKCYNQVDFLPTSGNPCLQGIAQHQEL